MAEDQSGADQFKDIETGSSEADSSSKNREITTESSPTPNKPPTSVKGEKTTANENPKSESQEKDKGDSATPEESNLVKNILDDVFDFMHDLIKFVCAILGLKKLTIWKILQWIALFCFTGCLIASLTVEKLQIHLIWGFELWKWCVLLMVAICGRLISEWIVNVVFLFTHWLFADQIKIYCFVYGLKQKNRVFVWWGLVLVAWLVLVIACVENGDRRSKETREILDYITRVLASLFFGAGLWLGKDLSLWSFAHSFQSKVFFDRILKAMFCKHVIESLLDRQSFGKRVYDLWWIDWAYEINLVNEGKVSAVSIKLFIDVISDSKMLELQDISCEEKVKPASDKIYDILRHGERDLTIKKMDLSNIKPEDVDKYLLFQLIGETLQILEGTSDTIKIERSQFEQWLKTVYKECKSLECSLRNTRRGMEAVDKLATGIVLILTCIVWLLMLKLLSGKAVALMLSQFLVLTFVFGDTCKKIFEGIVFVYVTHPFDIGDFCVIEDGKEMVVKEINIKTTVFSMVDAVDRKDDKEKVVYPNSVLATKSIRNFRRHLCDDSVEIVVDASPCKEEIEDLKNKIKQYAKERSWEIKDLNILANGLNDGDKIKMGVYLTYNHIESNNEKSMRKSEIVLFLKQILKDKVIVGGKTENVEFLVDASTSIKQIEDLNSRLRKHIEEKGPSIKDISVHANGFEDGDKIKMGVYVTYKDFWKDNGEKIAWKSKIVLGLKQILEDMGISKYSKED